MIELLRLLHAELLKLKRSKVLLLTLVMPLFVVGLNFAMLFNSKNTVDSGEQLWDVHIISTNLSMWFMVMNTLYIALMTALLAGLEHTANTWKYLFALRISRGPIYFVKLIVAVGLSAIANILFLVFALGSGFLADAIRPSLNFDFSSLHGMEYVRLLLLGTIASLFMISLQLYLSLRIRNFIVPVAIGFMGTVANLIATSSMFFEKFSPWLYPLDALMASGTPLLQHLDYAGWGLVPLLTINLFGFLFLATATVLSIQKQDVA
jgi:ABC-2 type transport system permease protein